MREGGREREGGVIQHYSGLASGAGEGKKDSGVLAGVLGGWVLLVEKMERGQKWPGEPETLSSRRLDVTSDAWLKPKGKIGAQVFGIVSIQVDAVQVFGIISIQAG